MKPGWETSGGRPRVTIAIPCFNYARFLPGAIESALEQTYESTEVLVVDDGSTDGTRGVVDGFGSRLSYLYKHNGGLSSARNAGAQAARGEFVSFLDADDWLDPRYVERCVCEFDLDPLLAFVYSQARLVGTESGVTAQPDFDRATLATGNYVAGGGSMVRTELVRRFPFDESLRVAWEDWDFFLTLAEHGFGGRLIDEPLVYYRRHPESMTGRLRYDQKIALRRKIARRHTKLYTRSTLLRLDARFVKSKLANLLRTTRQR